jgi:hypothetical protein
LDWRRLHRLCAIANLWEEIMKRLGLGIIVAIGLTLPAFGQSANALIGTWKFNPEKSSANYPLNRSNDMIFSGEGQNLRNTIEAIDAQGRPFKEVYIHIYDGMPHPTIGNPDYDSSIYTRVDSHNVNFIRFKEGKVVAFGHLKVSPDGKTYIGSTEGIAADGQQYYGLLVWDRQ